MFIALVYYYINATYIKTAYYKIAEMVC